MGGAVSDTIRKKIVNVEAYNETSSEDIKKFLIGQLSAMFGAAVWQIIASGNVHYQTRTFYSDKKEHS